jgi:uncharacterized membrane protein YfhO
LTRLDALDFDPAKVALVPLGTSLSLESAPVNEKGQVAIIHRIPSSLVLDVTAPTDSLLVLSEVYYPGWRAIIDGQSSPILRANYLLRGIRIPAGQHRVEVRYRPATLTLGAAISGITLGLIIIAGIWVWTRHSDKTSSELRKTSQQIGS